VPAGSNANANTGERRRAAADNRAAVSDLTAAGDSDTIQV
jgi:hypothetical protein